MEEKKVVGLTGEEIAERINNNEAIQRVMNAIDNHDPAAEEADMYRTICTDCLEIKSTVASHRLYHPIEYDQNFYRNQIDILEDMRDTMIEYRDGDLYHPDQWQCTIDMIDKVYDYINNAIGMDQHNDTFYDVMRLIRKSVMR